MADLTDEQLQFLFQGASESYDGPVDTAGLRAVYEAGRPARRTEVACEDRQPGGHHLLCTLRSGHLGPHQAQLEEDGPAVAEWLAATDLKP